jgi:transposase
MASSAGTRRSEALKQRRLEASKLFTKGATQAEGARRMGVSRVSALRWYRIWRKSGRRGLGETAALGRPNRLGRMELKRIEAGLLKGPQAQGYSTDVWTLPRVAVLIERVSGVHYHPGHVWRVMRGLGWSLQRPALRARERDEELITRWKRESWPRAKKAPGPTAR